MLCVAAGDYVSPCRKTFGLSWVFLGSQVLKLYRGASASRDTCSPMSSCSFSGNNMAGGSEDSVAIGCPWSRSSTCVAPVR